MMTGNYNGRVIGSTKALLGLPVSVLWSLMIITSLMKQKVVGFMTTYLVAPFIFC